MNLLERRVAECAWLLGKLGRLLKGFCFPRVHKAQSRHACHQLSTQIPCSSRATARRSSIRNQHHGSCRTGHPRTSTSYKKHRWSTQLVSAAGACLWSDQSQQQSPSHHLVDHAYQALLSTASEQQHAASFSFQVFAELWPLPLRCFVNGSIAG